MNPKHVWSVILIVIGVLFVISGITGFYSVSFYGQEIEYTDQLMKKHGGRIGNDFLNTERYHAVIQNSKLINIIQILLGILGSICGIILLNDKPKIIEDDIDEFEISPEDNARWRL